MTYTVLQFKILVTGLVAFLLGFTSGILFALHAYAAAAVAIALCVITWVVEYSITRASRPGPAHG